MRDADTIKSELRVLGDKISCEKDHTGTSIPTLEDTCRLWRHMFGSGSPREIYAMAARNCNDATILLSEGKVTFLHRDGNNSAETIIYGQFSKSRSVTLEGMHVEGRQGSGTAKKVISNLADIIETHFPGVSRIATVPTSVGSYAWARFGFTPGAKSWEHMKHAKEEEVFYSGLLEKKQTIASYRIMKTPRLTKSSAVKIPGRSGYLPIWECRFAIPNRRKRFRWESTCC